MNLAVLIITKNEEHSISECLSSVKWANEIVVVDAYSTDSTTEIAGQYTNTIYQRHWSGYSEQKNFGHTKCNSEWVLSIDADERVTTELKKEIELAIDSSYYSAYRIPIKDYMFGSWIQHGSWPKQRPIRLYRKHIAEWQSEVHEKIVINGNIGSLSNPLLHYSHLTIAKFVAKMNTYTDLEAQRWYQQGLRKNWMVIILSSIRIFFLEYIAQQGFKDKGHGLVLAILMAQYHFLARVKLWELWYKHDREINK